MSYILDALRRANAERERGHVPTLNTNPGPADLSVDDDDDGPRVAAAAPAAPHASLPPLLLGGAAAVALLALGAAAAWMFGRTDEPAVPARQALEIAPAPIAVAPGSSPAPMPAPTPAPALSTVATVPLSVPPRIEPAPVAPAPAPTPAPAPPAPMPTRDQLPAALRQQLPPLSTSGAMYSDTPAQRMVIINGQLLHEGDKLAPELVLEEIRLKHAVLSFKGQRFTLAY